MFSNFILWKKQMNRKIELLYKTNIPKIQKKGDKESLLDTFVVMLKKKGHRCIKWKKKKSVLETLISP